MMVKTIFWDFDGVILDSMKVRDWGFEQIFKSFKKEDIDRLLKYHRENGGLSRYVKIRYFFEELLSQSIEEEEVLVYAEKFSRLMRKELINPSNLIVDSVKFIKNNFKRYNFHIVSGSDQEELRFLCKELNINKYFNSINGSPTDKSILIKNILNNHDISLENCCLIGDSINDFEAALKNKIKFYSYNNKKIIDLDSHIINFSNFLPFN